MNTQTTAADTRVFDLVRHSVIAAELTAEQSRVLAELVTIRDLADGEVLVEEGQSDNHLHVVVSGTLSVARRSEGNGKWVVLHTLSKGQTAGELAFIDGKRHYAAVVATGPTQVFTLEREKLEALLDTHPHIVYRVMRSIFRIAHELLHRMAFQASELTNYIYKQHGRY